MLHNHMREKHKKEKKGGGGSGYYIQRNLYICILLEKQYFKKNSIKTQEKYLFINPTNV